MIVGLWIAGIAAALYALHQLGLWMERRGWIYCAKNRASGDALGSAFLEIQSLAQPEKKYILEVQREKRVERDHEAEPKQPNGAGGADEAGATKRLHLSETYRRN